MPVDRDRQAVYDAEDDVFAHTTAAEPARFGDLVEVAADLCRDHRWVAAGCRSFTVARTRSDAGLSHASLRAGGHVVKLSPLGENPSTLVHEAAHVAVNSTVASAVASHGPQFRGAELWVAEIVLGPEAAGRLASSFARCGLDVVAMDAPTAGPVLWDRLVLGRRREELARLAGSRPGPERIGGAIPL